MVLLGLSAFLSLPSATLQLVCRHDFRSADITVSIDGEVVHTDTLTGIFFRSPDGDAAVGGSSC